MGNYLITGANSEIGSALAKHLLEKKHNLILTSRSPKKDGFGDTPWIDNIDLTDEDKLSAFGDFVANHYSTPFTFIHSVGNFWKHKSITSTSFCEAKEQMLSHYITLFGAIKAVVPIMQAVGGGKIIAFSCNSVKYNYPDMAAFTSAKAAVNCLIKCVANEQSEHGIIANAFALPSIKTESVIRTKPEDHHKDYITLPELVSCIETLTESLTPLTNGNIISLFKYSDSFYHKGYYERNIIWEDNDLG